MSDDTFCWLPLDTPLLEVESIDSSEGGRAITAWVRTTDGRCALWTWQLAAPPGSAQTLALIPGA